MLIPFLFLGLAFSKPKPELAINIPPAILKAEMVIPKNFKTYSPTKNAINNIRTHARGPIGINLIVNQSNIKYPEQLDCCIEMKVDFIDYKNIELLKISMSERGKIMPRRLTGNSKNSQEMVEKAIKRARHMALVPYIVDTQNVSDSAYSKSFL